MRGDGDDYFSGLSSPVWPQRYLGRIDWQEADRGAALYDQKCASCHLPPTAGLVEPDPNNPRLIRPAAATLPVASDGTRTTSSPGSPWISNNDSYMLSDLAPGPYEHEEWFLSLETVNIGTIRTDPGQAENFARNIIDSKLILLPPVPKFTGEFDGNGDPIEKIQYPQRIIPAGVGLQMVTIGIAYDYYDRVDAQLAAGGVEEFVATLPWNLLQGTANGVPPAAGRPRIPADRLLRADGTIDRDLWNGYRPPGALVLPHYSVRPLNGIWATAPYLHNGSVPNVYELLSPRVQRSKTFYMGSRQYDPRNLGYRTERLRGAFKFDTRATGNSNDGHRFEDGPPGDGIIGGELSDGERLAIIEFLKTLC